MRVRRRPAWPVVMLISGAIASTTIGTASVLDSAAAASSAVSTHQAARAGSSLRPVPGARWPGRLARPQAAGFGFLVGVYCTSRASCWAVGVQGGSGNATLSQALHWNGKAWRHVKMPSPGGTGPNAKTELAAVRCATANACWAVGYYVKAGATLNAMLHWNGRKWTAMGTPEPAGSGKTSQNELTDVTCISVRSCWAVGSFGKVGSTTLDEVLRWNGTKWSRVRVPEPGGTTKVSVNMLNDVRCPTSSRCIAVGSYSSGSGKTFNQVLTWAGGSWSRQHAPSPGSGTAHNVSILFGLGCGARKSCWAVGTFGPTSQDKFLNQVLHWNGHTWSRTPVSQPGGTGATALNELGWVTCSSAGNCWAVGAYGGTNPSTELNQAQHWNGKRWVFVHTPNPVGTAANDENVLFSVRCTAASNCWAVGGTEKAGSVTVADEILRWNGRKWSVSPA
jgi:hypothetical protein